MTPEIKQRIAQIQRGEVPEGYKKTKMWICPVEWEVTTLNKVADIGQGYTFKREYQGQSVGRWNYFKVADIGLKNTGIFLSYAINKIDDSLIKQIGCKPFSAGSIVFPRVGAALLNNNKKILLQDSIVDDNVLVLTVKDAFTCNNIFLYYLLSRLRLEDWCNSGHVPVINSKTVLKQTVNIPSIEVQQKIVVILTTQDKIIELKEKLLAEKQHQKKYLMQQLLTGKKRLPGFNGEWKKVKLSAVLEERKEKKQEQELRICSVAVQKGVIDQIEHLGRSYAASNTSNYGVAYYGDIIYTKSPTGDFPYGIIKQNLLHEKVAVSPLYGIFKPVTFGMGYILHTYFQDDINAKNYLLPIIQKGAKNTINITNETFLLNALYLPLNPKEQEEISKIFEVADHEIDLIQKDIEQEKQKKKALMQLLLTGIVRVKL